MPKFDAMLNVIYFMLMSLLYYIFTLLLFLQDAIFPFGPDNFYNFYSLTATIWIIVLNSMKKQGLVSLTCRLYYGTYYISLFKNEKKNKNH